MPSSLYLTAKYVAKDLASNRRIRGFKLAKLHKVRNDKVGNKELFNTL